MIVSLRDILPSHTVVNPITEDDLKHYRHFDAIITLQEAQNIVSKLERGEKHSYAPLLRYVTKWRRAPAYIKTMVNGKIIVEKREREPKKRPISYASHQDAIAYKYVRESLSPIFERSLVDDGLHDCVIAYRRIANPRSNGNKSNIDFAYEAFLKVRELDSCCVVAVDIKDYFGNIEHAKLKDRLLSLIDRHQMPSDLAGAFRNVTNYRFVELDSAYRALGYSEVRKGRLRFKVKKSKIPRKLCSTKEFRRKIHDGGLIQKHNKSRGIPQGTPVSDIFANMYLREVDIELKEYAARKNGFYFRYSDDILIILPGDGRTANGTERYINSTLANFSPHLRIGRAKTEIAIFKNGLCTYTLHPVEGSKNKIRGIGTQGISYLGFRFDGERAYLRDSTLANLRRKIVKRCHVIGANHVKRYPNKSLAWLLQNIPIHETKALYLQMERSSVTPSGAVRSSNNPSTNDERNFYTYLKTAENTFKDLAPQFRKQTRNIEKLIEITLVEAIEHTHSKN